MEYRTNKLIKFTICDVNRVIESTSVRDRLIIENENRF